MNSIFSARSVVSKAVFSAPILATLADSPKASAASVEYTDMCRRDVNVVQWTPQKGPIARFVADTYIRNHQTGVWIGLGRVGTSFWSAEGGDNNDACDDCRSFYLVETRADGTRKQHALIDWQNREQLGPDPAAQKAHILSRLWQLADHTWPADKLMQDYTLTLGQPDANDAKNELKFAVRVATKNVLDLRYDFTAGTSMCWCIYEWNGRVAR